MAFLRTEKKTSGTYLRIVESYRDDNGKTRHKTLCNLGKAEDYSQKTLKKMGQMLINLSGIATPQATGSVSELARINYGFPQVYHRLMQHYDLDRILNNIENRQQLTYSLYKTILLMLIERLNDPCSKLANFGHIDEYRGFEGIQLHNLYRGLDQLSENQGLIQEVIYSKGRHLFNQKLDVVFYDVTTFYFDSEKEDGFRMQGYSKDGKIGKSVIVFGLLIDKDKNPVGYNIYRGGFYEGHSFKDALKKLKNEYEIEKVITVADRGMRSRGNIDNVENEAGYEYIIGERLKTLPKKIKEKILDLNAYKDLEILSEDGNETIKIKYSIVNYEGKRLITTYSSKRATKDRYDREKRIGKGLAMMNTPSAIDKKARRNYLKRTDNGKYEQDIDKTEADARYDGLACIATNNKQMPVDEVLSAYKQLYKIEQTFRTFKSYLETRPMFHWTQKRIEGHLCLCYIAFTMLNYLGNRLKREGIKLSENKIRDTLSKMQLSLLDNDGEKMYLRSNLNDDMKNILKVLKLKRIPDVVKNDSLSDYISID